jgi:putative SOS response-associated peptidase YedK
MNDGTNSRGCELRRAGVRLGSGYAPITNLRNLKSLYWRGWLKAEWRCLVPATSFCECTDSRPKVTHWFALDEGRPLFAFPGIWRL